jgi:hypothetical protein
LGLLSCVEADQGPGGHDSPPRDDTSSVGDTSEEDTGDGQEPREDRWTFAVFMNGDNNLDAYVEHDLNELERVGSGDGVNVLVQADRSADRDNTWTGTRRYYIKHDTDPGTVHSRIMDDLGEQDMGDPGTLADFLLWADSRYPARHFALVMWDHGDSWNLVPPPPGISEDGTSRSWMSIAEGELSEALRPLVARRGPLDVIGFDACLMASWEVAHSLREQASYLAGSEASEGWEGYAYEPLLAMMREDDQVSPAEVAAELARGAVEEGGEDTHSAIDLTRINALSTAMDSLAERVLDDETREPTILSLRDDARGMYPGWEDWYLDLGDFAWIVETAPDPALAEAGRAVREALEGAVVAHHESARYRFARGLTVFFDLSDPASLDLYQGGAGATWAQETRWDEMLLKLADTTPSLR